MEDRFADDPAVRLLVDLASALREVPTRRALARRAWSVLVGAARLVELELPGDAPRAVVRASRVGDDVRVEDARLRAQAGRVDAPTSAAPDARATRLGAQRIVILPLLASNAVAVLRCAGVRAPSLPWQAVACLLDTALASCALVERLARGSRRVNEDRRRLQSEVEALAAPPDLVSRSPAMRAARDRVDLVAEHDTTVLLLGESGTGKELFARRLHARSRRRNRPFVVVNCGALPEGLVESELFGHEAGAFTGAVVARAGRFERADRGTLFLDEIGDLPLPQQVKLLRVLQEGEVERVGAAATRRVDVRVVAATHRDLPGLVAAGRFREDLFWRLDVFCVVLPSLRERAEDLPLLVRSLLETTCARLGRPVPSLDGATLDLLAGHDWPGNVRELASVVEESVILTPGDSLVVPQDFAARNARRGAAARAHVVTFDDAARAAIEAALAAAHGKVYGTEGAAALLGLKPTTLQSKMRRLGIESRS